MSQIHYQRLAWDSARTIVTSIEANVWPWLAYELGERVAPEMREHVVDSFVRMDGRPERFAAEVGIWRATLTDLLIGRPGAADALVELMSEVRARLVPVAA
jgi:hypothetical protein